MTLATTPDPPYYAVIFSSIRTEVDAAEYSAMAARMDALAAAQPGYLGAENAREGLGITISYWRDLESIAAWKRQADHLMAQQLGRARWYRDYRVRVAKVEREYGI